MNDVSTANPNDPPVVRRKRRWVVPTLVAAIFLLPTGIAFINKLFEFSRTIGTDELGAVALVPMLNYLAVAAGFFCLLIWAITGGMFKDIEKPKTRMLEIEDMLDSADFTLEKLER